jgi:hypothetical protein
VQAVHRLRLFDRRVRDVDDDRHGGRWVERGGGWRWLVVACLRVRTRRLKMRCREDETANPRPVKAPVWLGRIGSTVRPCAP